MRSNKKEDWNYEQKIALMIRFLPEELDRFFKYKDSLGNHDPIGKFVDKLVKEASQKRG